MEAVAIQTETITPLNSSELLEKTMRVLATLNDGEGESTVTIEANLKPNTEEIQFFWAFLREGEEHYRRKHSTTLNLPVWPHESFKKLTVKQKLALNYIAQWRMGDPDRQTEILDQFMRDLEENRHGVR